MKIKELIEDYGIEEIAFGVIISVVLLFPIVGFVFLSVNEVRERIEIEQGTRFITMDGDTIEVHAYKYKPYGYKVN